MLLGRLRSLVGVLWFSGLLTQGAEVPSEIPITLTRKPYIQQTTPNSAIIVWRTHGLGAPQVRFGVTPETLANSVNEGLTKHPPLHTLINPPVEDDGLLRLDSALPDTYQHEFTINELEPQTRYFYAVYDGDELLAGGDALHYVQTLPVPGRDVTQRFWVVGDSGDGGLFQAQNFQAIQGLVAASGRPIDAYLHLGDMAYQSGEDDEFQRNFFDVYSSLLSHTVTWPTMGNHEGISSRGLSGTGPYFDTYVVPTRGEAGGVPSGSESYYSFDSGMIHFVCLNSHDLDRTPAGEMALWLREDLSRATAKWLIAFFHHPPYTKGTHDSDWELELMEMREHIMPILESHGVDLVLAGHSHTYERSMLIDGAYATPTVVDGVVYDDGDGDPGVDGDGPYRKSEGLHPNEGTVAVVAGHGRGALQHFGLMPVMRRTIPQAGSFLLDVSADTLTGYMVNIFGQIPDRFQIIKSGVVSPPERLTHPWRPFGPSVTTAFVGERRVKIAIAPNPPAPDAVVYYTLDGTAPTLESPRYESPIVVEQDVLLRTFSTWRDGTRASPETKTDWLRRHQIVGVRAPVNTGADDASEVAGVLESESERLVLGDGITALRFPEIYLPANATISRAYVQFSANGKDALPGQIGIRAEASWNARPLVAEEGMLAVRARTEAEVSWEMEPWSFTRQRSTAQRTPDLSSIVQELIAQDGWVPGASLNLFFEKRADDAGGTRGVFSAEAGEGTAPFLLIDYELGVPLEVAASRPPRFTQVVRDGELVTLLSFRRYVGLVEGESLTYTVEVSETMEPTSWKPSDEWKEAPAGVTLEGPWQFLRYERQGETSDTQFVRIRVSLP